MATGAGEGRLALADRVDVEGMLAEGRYLARIAPNVVVKLPLTENGLIRVACQQPSDDVLVRPADVIANLERFCRDKLHRTWTDAVSLTDTALFAPQFISGHRQLTDVYLLGLAKMMGGRLATFDRTIPVKAVRGGTAELLHVIEP